MEDITKGHLILLIGPSGSGKSTLKSYIYRVFGSKLCYPVSCTTRGVRPGEREGVNFYFKTREEFAALQREGAFLETDEHSGNLYGTLKSEVIERMNRNAVVLREIEPNGYRTLLTKIPRERISLIMVVGDTWEQMLARAQKRAPLSDEEIIEREKHYHVEMALVPEADYIVVNKEGRINEAENAIHEVVEQILKKHTPQTCSLDA